MKRALLVLIAVALVGGVAWKVHQATPASAGSGRRGGRGAFTVPVEVSPVRTADLRDTRLLSGTLRAGAQYVVAAKTSGQLERLHVDLGDTVTNGQLVAELDDEEFTLQVAQARAELAVSRSTLEQRESGLSVARAEYERAKSLHAQNITSQAVLEAAEAEYRAREADRNVARAQVDQRQAGLQAAEVRLSHTRLHAAWSSGDDAGPRRVGERFADEGALLSPNSAIVSLIDLDPLVAVVNVIERDYAQIAAGLPAQVTTDAYPERAFPGVVRRVAPLLQERSRQAQVEVEVPNPAGLLKPGMFVRVRVELRRRADACVVPQAAVVRRGERDGVFLLDATAGKARFVPVELGIAEGGWVEVVAPVISGDVVTLGHHLLVDGSAAAVAATDASADAADEVSVAAPGGPARSAP